MFENISAQSSKMSAKPDPPLRQVVTSHVTPNATEILQAIELLHGERDRIELRVIHHATVDAKPRIDVGMFDRAHISELVSHAVDQNKTGTVCVNLNPILPSYVPRNINCMRRAYQGDAVSDKDVASIEYLLFDCDSRRPSKTSATDEQVAAASETALHMKTYLTSLGWPAPVECASGNGAHLLYRVKLPNDSTSRALFKELLEAVGQRFDNDKVKIDRSVGKPGQIVKLYGTVANKGENTTETPHRLSRIVSVPDTWDIVPLQLMRKALPSPVTYAGLLGPRPAHLSMGSGSSLAGLLGRQFDLAGFLHRLDIPYTKKTKADGTESYILKHCPFNPDHDRGESGISRNPDGKLGFHCFHNSCSDKNWSSLRALVDNKPFQIPALENNDASIWSSVTPQKLPSALRPIPIFSAAALPDAFASAAIDLADRLQCPIEYLAASMLSVAGAVVGNKIGIFPYANDETWEVYPALWGGIVGDPGSKKTPALQAAHRPLRHIEDLARQNYAAAMQAHQIAVSKYEAALEDWQKSKASGPKPTAPEPPKRPRLVVHDTTYQALGVMLADNPSGVLAIGDELSGLLQSLDSPGQEAARGFFLSGWSGTQGYSFDRVTRGSIDLPRYCLSVFGGFQPDRIKTYVGATQRGMSTNDGLLQRFQLLVWPDPQPNVTLVDRKPDQAAQNAYTNAIIRLRTLSLTELPQATVLPNKSLLLHFDPEAQQIFNDWFVLNEKLLSGGKIDHARQSHFAKYRSMVPALALLFHLADEHPGQVCCQCIKKAIDLGGILKKHANRIYASVSGHDHEATRTLAAHLLKGDLPDGFTRRSVIMKGWMGLSTQDKAQSALDALGEFGWLLAEETRGMGRPTVRYYLNPMVTAELL